MRWTYGKKRGILIASILVFIFILAAITSQSNDSSPAGDSSNSRPTIIVPHMSPPKFDGVVTDDWSGACQIDIVFTIPTEENRSRFREIPASIHMGHDDEYLYVASIIRSPGLNPYTIQGYDWVPDIVRLLFDCDNDGRLSFPEDGKQWYYFMDYDARGWYPIDCFNGDLYYGTDVYEHGIHNGWPSTTNWTYDDLYDDDYLNSEGAVFIAPPDKFYVASNEEGDQIVEIFKCLAEKGGNILATRADEEIYEQVKKALLEILPYWEGKTLHDHMTVIRPKIGRAHV